MRGWNLAELAGVNILSSHCAESSGGERGRCPDRSCFPLHSAGHRVTLHQQRRCVLPQKELTDTIWFRELSRMTQAGNELISCDLVKILAFCDKVVWSPVCRIRRFWSSFKRHCRSVGKWNALHLMKDFHSEEMIFNHLKSVCVHMHAYVCVCWCVVYSKRKST